MSQQAFREYERFSAAADRKGMEPFLHSKSVLPLAKGISVLVVTRYDFQARGGSAVFVGGSSDYASYAQQAALSGSASDRSTNFLEVRILDGEFAGRLLFVPEADLVRLVPAPPPPRPRRKPSLRPTSDPARDSDRAVTLLKSAEGLERVGKAAGALSLYRQIARAAALAR